MRARFESGGGSSFRARRGTIQRSIAPHWTLRPQGPQQETLGHPELQPEEVRCVIVALELRFCGSEISVLALERD